MYSVRRMEHRGLTQVAQLATDLDRSIAFYRDVLGLRFLERFDPPGLAFFDLGGGTRLLLEGNARPATLYLAVADLDAAWAELEGAGADLVRAPHVIHTHDGTMAPAGTVERQAFVTDPEGTLVGLVEQGERRVGSAS